MTLVLLATKGARKTKELKCLGRNKEKKKKKKKKKNPAKVAGTLLEFLLLMVGSRG